MFQNLKIGTRLTIGFGCMIVLLLLLGGFALRETSLLKTETAVIADEYFPKTNMAQNAATDVRIIALALRNMALADSPQEYGRERERIAKARQQVKETMETLQQRVTTPDEKELLATVTAARQTYVHDSEAAIAMFVNDDVTSARLLMKGDLRKSQNEYLDLFVKLVEFYSKKTAEAGKADQTEAATARLMTIAILAGAIVAALVVGWYITRTITTPLSRLTPLAQRIADGDLTVTIDDCSRDEIGQLCDSFRSMAANLRSAVSQITQNAQLVATVSNQLHSTAEQIATGAEEQTATTSEIATNISQITVVVQDTSRGAQESATASGELARLAEELQNVVRRFKVS